MSNLIQNIPKEYRYLGLIMGLPLIDGVFLSIVINNGLNSIIDALIIGAFVLGGGASISIIMSEFDNDLYTTIKRVLIIGLIITIIAIIQALFAPILESFINTDIFIYGAVLALIALAYKIIPIGKKYMIFQPGIIILITLIFSIQLDYSVELIDINLMYGIYALISGLLATSISLMTVIYRSKLIKLLDENIIKYTTGVGLVTIALSLINIIPSVTTIIIFIFGFIIAILKNNI